MHIKEKTGPFRFKQFSIGHDPRVMKVGTDAVLLGAWASHEGPAHILDIGTGSGVIALMMAQRFPTAQVTAIDLDEASVALATKNFTLSPYSDRLAAIHLPVQQFFAENKLYDLIVSNPPFFTGGAFTHQGERQVMRHTTKLSHNELLCSVRNLLAPSGTFAVVLPYLEGLRFIELAGLYHLYTHKQLRVRSLADKKVERLLLGLKLQPGEMEVKELVIQQSTKAHDYTDEYIGLTKEFYLNMSDQ